MYLAVLWTGANICFIIDHIRLLLLLLLLGLGKKEELWPMFTDIRSMSTCIQMDVSAGFIAIPVIKNVAELFDPLTVSMHNLCTIVTT